MEDEIKRLKGKIRCLEMEHNMLFRAYYIDKFNSLDFNKAYGCTEELYEYLVGLELIEPIDPVELSKRICRQKAYNEMDEYYMKCNLLNEFQWTELNVEQVIYVRDMIINDANIREIII